MKFRILFRDFRCSTAKKLKKDSKYKRKRNYGTRRKKREDELRKGFVQRARLMIYFGFWLKWLVFLSNFKK
jgi:hypothetical protein